LAYSRLRVGVFESEYLSLLEIPAEINFARMCFNAFYPIITRWHCSTSIHSQHAWQPTFFLINNSVDVYFLSTSETFYTDSAST